MGKKQRRQIAGAMAAVSDYESRVIIATGSYIGEGLDDGRLDTLFLAMPISWKGTLQQHVGRRHRLHDNKRVVQVYDYVDNAVPMLARMYERRPKGYSAIGYTIEQATVIPSLPPPSDPGDAVGESQCIARRLVRVHNWITDDGFGRCSVRRCSLFD
jgi:hypothetical protein